MLILYEYYRNSNCAQGPFAFGDNDFLCRQHNFCNELYGYCAHMTKEKKMTRRRQDSQRTLQVSIANLWSIPLPEKIAE